MKSKDFMTPVIPCRPDFKGLNFFSTDLANIVSHSQSLDNSLNGSVYGGLSPNHRVEDTFEKESEAPADKTEYAAWFCYSYLSVVASIAHHHSSVVNKIAIYTL